MEMLKPTVNDFFCGAGGVGLGFKNAGFDVIWACDFDKFCVETYKANVGDYVIQEDIRQLNCKDIPKADVWAFGFPCQDLSIAGKQKGFRFACKSCGAEWEYDEDGSNTACPICGSGDYTAATRSGMFFEMMRLIDETTKETPENIPLALFIENVKGLRKYIPTLKRELKAHGYTAHIQLYNSKYWDVPQNRERYYIVAVRDNVQGFAFPEEQHEHVPKLSTVLDKHVEEKYYIPDEKAQKIIARALEGLNGMNGIKRCPNCNRIFLPCDLAITKCSENMVGTYSIDFCPKCFSTLEMLRSTTENKTEMFTLTAQDVHGVLVSKCATHLERGTDIASCLMARDYKGFGN